MLLYIVIEFFIRELAESVYQRKYYKEDKNVNDDIFYK